MFNIIVCVCIYIVSQHKAWLAHTTDSYQLFLETAANDLSSANSNFRSSLKCVTACVHLSVLCTLCVPLYMSMMYIEFVLCVCVRVFASLYVHVCLFVHAVMCMYTLLVMGELLCAYK